MRNISFWARAGEMGVQGEEPGSAGGRRTCIPCDGAAGLWISPEAAGTRGFFPLPGTRRNNRLLPEIGKRSASGVRQTGEWAKPSPKGRAYSELGGGPPRAQRAGRASFFLHLRKRPKKLTIIFIIRRWRVKVRCA